MSSSVISPAIEAAFAERMRPRHAELPYHNFDGHVMSAIGYFDDIADALAPEGVHLDRGLGHVILLGHDADAHLPLTGENSSEEERSASIAAGELEDLGVGKPSIQIVEAGILATHVDAEPQTNLEKAVRLADIGNLTSSEREFLRNYFLIIQEAIELRRPLQETFALHCRVIEDYLERYLLPEPVFIADDGSEVTLTRHVGAARKNLAALGSLTFGGLLKAAKASRLPGVPERWLR